MVILIVKVATDNIMGHCIMFNDAEVASQELLVSNGLLFQ